MREINFKPETYLEIKKQEKVTVRADNGEIVPAIKVTRHLAEDEVSLGSFKNPNKEIVHFEYKENKEPTDFLGRLFRG